jgi:tRNA dimethylallyltransferase
MHCDALHAWYLTGPTASGKTDVGLELAQLLDAEILSLDSMAVYRGMDIGTAKPTPADRQRVPHHLIDIVAPDQPFSVAQYLDLARQAMQQVQGRGKEILFVGGTPLYLKALLRGMSPGPPGDPEFRRQVTEEVRRVGVAALHERLRLVDPLSAARLHPHDTRRMIRALEVYRQTGRPISHFQLQFDQGRAADTCRVFVITWPRDQLHQRIDARVERMFGDGLVEEVRRLVDRYGQISSTARQAVGYRETLDYLDAPGNLAETISRTKARTRRFARRQETWFRGLTESRWIVRDPARSAAELARQVYEQGATIRPAAST